MMPMMDPDLIIPDKRLSLPRRGARRGLEQGGSIAQSIFRALAARYGFSVHTPVGELPESALNLLLYGTGKERIDIPYEREYGSGTYKATFRNHPKPGAAVQADPVGGYARVLRD